MARVTKRTVNALKKGSTDVILWDEKVPGFGIRCRPSGAKIYFLKYRTKSGRQRWLTLGRVGELKPNEARERAERERVSIREGADPAGALQRGRKEDTIAALADRYLKEHVEVHNRPSSIPEIRRVVEKIIKPGLGRFKIAELTRADVKEWHQRQNEAPYQANRALAYVSKMMSLAVKDWEIRTDNPCLGLQRFPERKRERYFSDEELTRIGTALSAAERTETEWPGFVLLVKLLATTGMRLGEVLNLRWVSVDITAGSIRLTDAKAGSRTVHLGADAVALLDAIDDRKGFVVHAATSDQAFTKTMAEKAWGRLKVSAKIENGRLHDLRHTAGTFAALSGANAFAVRDLLGHKTMAMTSRYVERAAGMVQATADAVSKRVVNALNATEQVPAQRPSAEIIPMPKRR